MNQEKFNPPCDCWTVEFPSYEDLTPQERAAVDVGGPWPIRVVETPQTLEGQRRHAAVLAVCTSWAPPLAHLRDFIRELASLLVNDLKKTRGEV